MNNKCLVFTLSLIFLFVGCYQQKRHCSGFKTGIFVFKSNINGIKKQTIFSRNDSIEISNYEGVIDTSSVRWVNNCEYILRNLKEASKAIQVKILLTNDSSYTFEYGYVGDLTNKKRGLAQRIKQ